MTSKFRGTNGRTPGSSGAYEVGYRKPPVEHQFRKGCSGNPFGRPRKRAASTGGSEAVERANAILIEEAYRPVVVRDGDKTRKMPALQATVRAAFLSAIKGDRLAQRSMLGLVKSAEGAKQMVRLEHLKSMIDYKCHWEGVIEQARKQGEPEPEPIPHPEDIIIDFGADRATICGPRTKQEKASWDRILQFRDGLQLDISEIARAYSRSRSAAMKAHLLETWKSDQSRYDEINDNLPKRYRKDLQDRCWENDGSRPGHRRKAEWPGDD